MRTRPRGLLALASLVVLILAALRPAAIPPVAPVDYDYVPAPTTTASEVTDLLVDEAHEQVYLAQRDDGLLVVDLEGSPITTVAMPGPQSSLALSEDGNTLFAVAEDDFDPDTSTSNAILGVDTTSFAVQPVADADGGCYFTTVQPIAGRLWYGTNCPAATGNGPFGYVDMADGSVHEVYVPDRGINGILAIPGQPDRLVMLVNRFVKLFQITVTRRLLTTPRVTVTELAQREYLTFSGVAAVSPDGKEIVAAKSNGGAHRYSTADLKSLGGYQGEWQRATGISVRADGTVAIGTGYGAGLSIHRPGQFTPIRTYDLNPSEDFPGGVVDHGLGWGSERIYAVRGNGDVFAFVPRLRPHLQVEVASRDFRYGDAVPVTVELDGPQTGREVVLWSIDRQGSRQRVGVVQVPADGPGTINATARRNGHFEAVFAGTDQYDPTYDRTASITVAAKVDPQITTGRLVKGVYLHPVNGTAVFRGTVRPNHAGDCLLVVVEVLSGGIWRDVRSTCSTLDGFSTVLASFQGSSVVAGTKFRVKGYFFGDEDNETAQSAWRYFKFVRTEA